jgi:hypothetical protein
MTFHPQELATHEGRLPSYPTSAMPGSKVKLRIMQLRVERGEHLHHPLDARHSDDSPGLEWREQLVSDGYAVRCDVKPQEVIVYKLPAAFAELALSSGSDV